MPDSPPRRGAAPSSDPCLEGLPYGVDDGGRLRHVAEVSRGLACGCRCPGCGGHLVARKGAVVAHHFAHRAEEEGRRCAGAWETALHRLAKEVLLAARSLRLPAVEHGGRVIRPAGSFAYDEASAEVAVGPYRADAELRRGDPAAPGGAALLVEVRVTHAVDPGKRAHLRAAGRAALEIDLSGLRRDAGRAEHERAVLDLGARATWIHNRHLQAEVERVRAERGRRDGWVRRKVEAEVRAAYATPRRRGDPRIGVQAVDAGLADHIGHEIPGDGCFAVHAGDWQAAVAVHAAVAAAGGTVTADDLLARLQLGGLLHDAFAHRVAWDADLVAHLEEAVPGFRTPQAVLARFCDLMAARGVLRRRGGGWAADRAEAHARADEMEAAPVRRRRLSELVSAVDPLLDGTSLERWLDAPVPRTGETPRRTAEGHDGAWRTPWTPDPLRDLLADLGRLARMLLPGGEPMEDLLGLPLEAAREQRRAEARARAEEVRRAAEEARRTASAEAVRLGVEDLRPLLGDDGAVAFVAARLGDICGAPAEAVDALDGAGASALRHAVRTERDRLRAEAAAEEARHRAEGDAAAEREARQAIGRVEASRLREGLRAAALAALGDADRAELWMRSAHPRLGGERPTEHCRDAATAARCRDLLVRAKPQRARR